MITQNLTVVGSQRQPRDQRVPVARITARCDRKQDADKGQPPAQTLPVSPTPVPFHQTQSPPRRRRQLRPPIAATHTAGAKIRWDISAGGANQKSLIFPPFAVTGRTPDRSWLASGESGTEPGFGGPDPDAFRPSNNGFARPSPTAFGRARHAGRPPRDARKHPTQGLPRIRTAGTASRAVSARCVRWAPDIGPKRDDRLKNARGRLR